MLHYTNGPSRGIAAIPIRQWTLSDLVHDRPATLESDPSSPPMVTVNRSEHELAHISSMIGQLERLLERESSPSSHAVFHAEYWRRRVESLLAQAGTATPVAARAAVLMARLDALDDALASAPRSARPVSR
ncbi:hypothetical protein [Paraburkholderia phenoliruptrix]|nr:hypothetical protein [Paraburkholderia phenoliruptrix]